MVKLKQCPFCGCEMSSDGDYVMRGEHDKSCYFYFVDNQADFDFESQKNIDMLHEAWNRRCTDGL